ncbi:unnamed protein product [Heligmosomoides polygyrus]|uniref:UPAR/Ly6 domain-containing protein n=1 Tax=Heligmosomoides polygyrus TaxID=6339 RepID=A0A183GDM5_HELPZ|nr:unnamed protein product [Heligmosomoides polygyrus]
MFQPSAFPVVLVTPEDASFDSCIVGDENHLNLSLSAPCPLIPRAGFKGDVSKTTVAATATTSCFQYESSCSVVLDESGIKNLGCVPCYWKERIEAMCYPSVNEGLHHCCCRTPNCNKRDGVLETSLGKGFDLTWNFKLRPGHWKELGMLVTNIDVTS